MVEDVADRVLYVKDPLLFFAVGLLLLALWVVHYFQDLGQMVVQVLPNLFVKIPRRGSPHLRLLERLVRAVCKRCFVYSFYVLWTVKGIFCLGGLVSTLRIILWKGESFLDRHAVFAESVKKDSVVWVRHAPQKVFHIVL